MPILLLLYPSEPVNLLTSISLAVVFLNAASGSVAYARQRRIDFRAGLLFAGASIPGAVAGVFTTSMIPRRSFDVIFGILMITGSVFLGLFPQQGSQRSASRRVRGVTHLLTDRGGTVYSYSFKPIIGVGISILVGFASSFLGIGGGIIHVPLLVHILTFPVHVATATSHFILTFMTLAATVVHLLSRVFLHGLHRTLALGVGVVAGAQLGAFLSARLKSVWILRALALALGAAGVRILIAAVS
jgi:uncharacterized membrane protein YfcA